MTAKPKPVLLALVAVTLVAATALAQQPTHEQVVRAQVSEGLNIAAGLAAAINEFFQDHGRFPQDNAEAGIDEPTSILGRYVISVTVGAGDGSIAIEYGNHADPAISGATLMLRATIRDPRPVWFCSGDDIHPKYYPENCSL